MKNLLKRPFAIFKKRSLRTYFSVFLHENSSFIIRRLYKIIFFKITVVVGINKKYFLIFSYIIIRMGRRLCKLKRLNIKIDYFIILRFNFYIPPTYPQVPISLLPYMEVRKRRFYSVLFLRKKGYRQ